MTENEPQASAPGPRWTEHHVEQLMGNLLRGGVLLAAVVVGAGGLVYLWGNGGRLVDYSAFHGESSDLRSIGAIFSRLLPLNGRALIQAGLLLLVATPVARVMFAVLAFFRAGDRLYVAVSLLVLALLLLSISGVVVL